MSFIDNDPPKDLDVGSIINNEGVNIYDAGKDKWKTKYNLALSLDEVRALLAHGERAFFSFHTNSKKKYEEALKTQERAKKYIEDDKTKKEDGLEK
ncbi:MAG: hypothetical protein E7376_01775 [Clostridiales bacterium]|nr:hypothetical protein [Clostridiales bacterium]